MSHNNGSYSYSNPNSNAYQRQYPPGYNTYPQGYQQNSTSTPSHASYSRSTAMIPTGSQDSSGSSDSTNSTSTYPSSYNVSPAAYSPNGTYGYNSSQLGYLAPSHSHRQYYPTAHPTSSNNTPAQQSKYPSTSTSTGTSKTIQGICIYPGCTRQFARTYDLDRHMKVHFPDPNGKLDCPYAREGSFCKRVGERGFTRKDHWSEHLRNVHMVDLPKSPRGTRNP